MTELRLSDGGAVTYDRRGDGPALVLLPGALTTRRSLAALAAELERDFCVVTLDYRSHGDSPRAAHGHTVTRFAQDVREVVAHEGLGAVTLVGWSMGALVAWEHLATSSPADAPAAIVSLGQSPSDLRRPDWPEGALTEQSVFELARSIQADPAVGYREVFHDEVLYAEALRNDVSAATLLLLDQTFRDYRGTIAGSDRPLLLVSGDDDPFVLESQVAWLREHASDFTHTVIAGAGHMAPFEAPAEVAAAIRDFCRR